MKKILTLLLILASCLLSAREYEYPFSLFVNSPMPGNWFYSAVSHSGGAEINAVEGRLPVTAAMFHTPGNALELNYRNVPGGHWEAVVYAGSLRGKDHFMATEVLSFWIFNPGDKVAVTDLPVIRFLKKDSSCSAEFRIPAFKPGQWERVVIPLELTRKFRTGLPEDLLGIVFSQPSLKAGGGPVVLYVDDIELLPGGPAGKVVQTPVLTTATGYPMHVDLCWEPATDSNIHLVKIYRSIDGGEFLPVGIQYPYTSRYADFVGVTGKNCTYRISFLSRDYSETALSGAMGDVTRALSDDGLLTMVQEASFRYYWEGCEPVSGMARENIPGRRNMVATGASGFGIMALIVGTERGFVDREQSVGRFLRILDYLERAETFHGVYPHFMDGPGGRAEPFFGQRDNGADLVETSFLFEGLLAARQYFGRDDKREKEIRDRITSIWEKAEYDWFRRTSDSPFFFWHWSPDQEWVINHPLIGWNETMVVYLLAIASPTHPVPPEMYYSGWAGQDERAIRYRKNWGQSEDGSRYANGNTYYGIRLDVGVNNGGPLFFTHYSYMGYDPHLLTDTYTNYFENNRNIARINYLYCVDNPKGFEGYGEGGWGLTASDGPFDYSADEAVAWQDHGKLTPTGAIASFPYTPEESMKALKNYYFNFGAFLWGEYGFRDSFSLSENWCSEIYMGLNQAPMTVMIENYRTGLIWNLFMANPEILEGLDRLKAAN